MTPLPAAVIAAASASSVAGVDTRCVGGRRATVPWPTSASHDRHLAARLRRDPLVGVEAGERATRRRCTRSAARRRASRAHRPSRAAAEPTAPQPSRKSAPKLTTSCAALKSSAGHAAPYACAVRRRSSRAAPRASYAQVRRHAVRRQPLIEEAPGSCRVSCWLMNTAFAGVPRLRASPMLLREQRRSALSHVVRLERAALAHHRRADSDRGCRAPAAPTDRVAQSAPRFTGCSGLPSSLIARPSRTSAITPHAGRALAAGGRVVRRDARHRVVRDDDVRNELPDLFGGAAHDRGRRRRWRPGP